MDTSNLIPELENLVGEYTDVDDYKKLNTLDSKIHTHDKLLLKQLSDVPVESLLRYREMYNLAKKFNETVEQECYLSPEYLTSLFLRFQILDSRFKTLKDLKKLRYTIYYSRDEALSNTTLEKFIFREAQILWDSVSGDSELISDETVESVIDANLSEIIKHYKNVPETNNGDVSKIKTVIHTFIEETIFDLLTPFFTDKNNLRYVDKASEYLEEFKTEIYNSILSYAEDYNTDFENDSGYDTP